LRSAQDPRITTIKDYSFSFLQWAGVAVVVVEEDDIINRTIRWFFTSQKYYD
jgi:hypothetical protein